MSSEKEENFTWVLQQCMALLRIKEVKVKVVVTGRDAALSYVMNKSLPRLAVML
jgi:hypothetical protein